MSLIEWLGSFIFATSAIGLGLFLYRLTTTSSERAKLIQKLEAAQRELEEARQRDAELAVLRERERLARDLHDSLGHGLATLSVQLEAAQRLYAVDSVRASALLDQMKDLTRGCMEQLRRALAGLRAPGLGEQPFLPAVKELCDALASRTGIPISCQLPADLPSLPSSVADALWRVVQEGLANVEKHAHASLATVAVVVEERQILVRVVDDGTGISPDAEMKAGHYGLRGLRERIEGLGGLFTLAGATPKGTMVQAQIPLLPE
jgi:signal transduction histidine kinase